VSSPHDPLADRIQAASTWYVLALAAGTVLVALLAIVILTALAAATAPYSPLSGSLHQAVVGLPTVLGLYEVGRRAVLRSPASWFRASRPDHRVVPWVAVGLAFPTVVLGLQLAALDATMSRPPSHPGATAGLVVSGLAAGLLAAVLEELAFRGALLRILETRWGPRVGVGVTAVVFAALHQGHAGGGIDLALVLAAMLAAGLLLAVVVVRTRSVWNAVVVHTGWNMFFGGQLVGVGRLGETPGPAVLQFHVAEPAGWLTGGEASLGASPMTTACLLAAAVVVARWGSASRWPGSPSGTVAGEDR
jgi:membrane protease YdiL (CAAX protease family)